MTDPTTLQTALRAVSDALDKPLRPPAPKTTDALLAERGKVHGEYSVHAQITQALKAIMHAAPNWAGLTPIQKETLEMNAHKVGRILAGDPSHRDHWDDIAGYARLVSQRLG